MEGISRYISIDMKTGKRLFAGLLVLVLLCGCSAPWGKKDETADAVDDSFVNFEKELGRALSRLKLRSITPFWEHKATAS